RASSATACSTNATLPNLNPEPSDSSVLFQNDTASSTSLMRGSPEAPITTTSGVLCQGTPNCPCAPVRAASASPNAVPHNTADTDTVFGRITCCGLLHSTARYPRSWAGCIGVPAGTA